MSGMEDLRIATLRPEDLKAIQRLEKELAPTVCLLAVEKKELYTLEAKMAPNVWQRVDAVYPEIKGLKAYYDEHEMVKEAKGWLKRFLINNTLFPKPKKRPIRIRQVTAGELEA